MIKRAVQAVVERCIDHAKEDIKLAAFVAKTAVDLIKPEPKKAPKR